jgi:diadenosine tetraphosphate (Ap4A) HIT family hydrolase
MKEKKTKFINARYAKSGFYKKVLTKVRDAKVCPLCTLQWHTNPILKTAGGWFITETFQPYPNAALHLLIVGKRHKENISELAAGDWKEISALQKWAIKQYHIKGGGIAMRFGDTAHTGATVAHLHMHLIVPKLKRGHAVPVMFPFG